MKKRNWYILVSFLALCTGLQAKKTHVKCLRKSTDGTCQLRSYYENGYRVAECKAPKNSTCTASVTFEDKKATCTAQPGKKCRAMVKAPPK